MKIIIKVSNWLIPWLCALGLLYGCQSIGSLITGQKPNIGSTPSEESSAGTASIPASTGSVEAGSQNGATPTTVMVIGQIPTLESSITSQLTNPAGDPVRFVFPTPGPAPVSAWRPPLNPVPWALSPHDHFYIVRPIAANDKNWPLASYRYGYVYFRDTVHTGVDIPNPLGTPVLAAAPGEVVWAGYGILYGRHGNTSDPYGLAVAIRHDYGYQGEPLYTLYAHMSQVYVTEAQRVAVGDHIGAVGNTGESTGPHLHFEVRLGRNWFFNTSNPELWMSPPQGWGVLVGRVMDSEGELLFLQDVMVQPKDGSKARTALTYGPKNVNPDAYYEENLVLGDLPAGKYVLEISYNGHVYTQPIDIWPGQSNYFTFYGETGFSLILPPEPVIGKKVIPKISTVP